MKHMARQQLLRNKGDLKLEYIGYRRKGTVGKPDDKYN